MGIPHVLAIPYPAQGHVIPLMELALCLVKHGIRVTFVNTEFNHRRVLESLPKADIIPQLINLASIPDGLESAEDRNDLGKLTGSILQVMPGKLEALIDDINASADDKITSLIVDENMGWALEVSEKKGIPGIAFWPAAAATLSYLISTRKLIDDGILDSSGSILKTHTIQLAPGVPEINSDQSLWASFGDAKTQKIIFELMEMNNRTVKKAEWVICNTILALEKATFELFPEILPIGPLLASNRLGGKSVGSFWFEDSDCLAWLDKQPLKSVIYVAFGSFTVFDQTQFHELAMGLELTNRPFLWVVRPDLTAELDNAYPTGFKNRILGRGRLASWAPQQNVLSHPSVACFLSHCGWNSTMEGLSNGIPFLCWPYFADQFLNQSYISDIWKVGLRFNRNKNGIIEREEIKNKIDQLLTNGNYKARALELKASIMDSVKEDGSSGKNLSNIINWIKDQKPSPATKNSLIPSSSG